MGPAGRRFALVVAVVTGTVITGTGCGGTGEGPAAVPVSSSATLSVLVPAVHTGPNAIQAGSAELLVIPASRAQSNLARLQIMAAQFGQATTVPVNVGACGVVAGTPCQAVLIVRFLGALGGLIDSVETAAFSLVGGGAVSAPAVQPRMTARLAARDTMLRLSFKAPQPLRIDAYDAIGTLLPARTYTWTTANSAVATVDSAGLVTARGVGRTTVTATREGRSMAVPVMAPAIENLSLIGPTAPVMARSPVRLQVAVEAAPGVSRAVRILSSDTTVAVVDTALNVITRREGVVRLTAQALADTMATGTLTLQVQPFQAALSWRMLSAVPRGPIPAGVNGLAGINGSNVWAVGCWWINRFNGTTWDPQPYFTQQGFCANAIAAVSSTEVYAFGNQIWRWNGSAWSQVVSSLPNGLLAATVMGNEVVAVGERGYAVRGRGTTWTPITGASPTGRLNAVGSDGQVTYAVGQQGAILRLDGIRWQVINTDVTPDWNSVVVRGPSDVYVAGVDHSVAWHYLVRRFNGSTWTAMPRTYAQPNCCSMRSLIPAGTALYALADNDLLFRLVDSTWVVESQSTTGSLYLGWSDGQRLMAAGWNGVTAIRSLAPATTPWTLLTNSPSYYATWAESPNFLVMGGSGGIDLFDGKSWTPMRGDMVRPISNIWGSSQRDIWAVGVWGNLMRFRGQQWEPWPIQSTSWPNDVWGVAADTVWSVWQNGDIMRFDGTTWRTVFRSRGTLLAIHGLHSRYLLATGNDGKVWRFDGRLWQQEDSGTDSHIRQVWVYDTLTAFAAAGNTILERKNGVWKSWTFPPNVNFHWVKGTGPRDVYAGGCNTEILRYDGESWRPFTSPNGTGCALSGWIFPSQGIAAGTFNRMFYSGMSPTGVAPGIPR